MKIVNFILGARGNYLEDSEEKVLLNVLKTYTEYNKSILCYNNTEIQLDMYGEERTKHVVVWNKLYKRFIYENIRFPLGKINEDEFTTYIAFDTSSKIVVLKDSLYYYRINSNSIMGSVFNSRRLVALEALESRKLYYKESICI